jgi:hypothetical protein
MTSIPWCIIQRKDELIQNCVRQTALFDQGSIQFAEHPKQLVFAVNNLSDDDDEFQKIRSAVQTTVEGDEFTIECPSSWLSYIEPNSQSKAQI